MLGQLEEIARRHGVTMATIAHAGDGNLHPLLITPPGDDAARPAAQAAFEEMLDAAIALGGTVTGEHGVGLLKRDGMLRELRPAVDRGAARHQADPRPARDLQPGQGRRSSTPTTSQSRSAPGAYAASSASTSSSVS